MPAYDSTGFQPPAPVALVTVRLTATGVAVPNVTMLLDTGADVSFVPREAIAQLLETGQVLPQYELEAFDGTTSVAPAMHLELQFLGKSFRGQFLVIEQSYGVIGRNVLNNISLVFDGPALNWKEIR